MRIFFPWMNTLLHTTLLGCDGKEEEKSSICFVPEHHHTKLADSVKFIMLKCKKNNAIVLINNFIIKFLS